MEMQRGESLFCIEYLLCTRINKKYIITTMNIKKTLNRITVSSKAPLKNSSLFIGNPLFPEGEQNKILGGRLQEQYL